MKTPRTYDEISRRTVPDPDSSFRPLLPVKASTNIDLRERVVDALEANGFFGLAFEVDGARVTIRGVLRDAARIEEVIAGVDGVEAVRLVRTAR